MVEQQAGVSAQRQSARQKLAKLTPGQFEELSTDVFDEMNRRLANREDGTSSPSLPMTGVGIQTLGSSLLATRRSLSSETQPGTPETGHTQRNPVQRSCQ